MSVQSDGVVSVDYNAPSSWSAAQRSARLLGPLPSSVGNVVKSLWKDHLSALETGEVQISHTSNSAVRLVDKSSVLKMPLYFAAQELHPERFATVNEDDTSRALIKILEPGLFAALLSLLYMHRRFNKMCVAEQWEALSKEFILNMELGYLIGRGCPRISEGTGVLAGGIRFSALALYLKQDPSSYDGYRNRKLLFDLEAEHERWRCDHGQVSGCLLRAFGFASDQMAAAFALRGHGDKETPSELVPWSVVISLMDALKQKVPLSSVDLSPFHFALSQSEVKSIEESTNTLFEKGSSFSWMLKKIKED
ncbi:hypothetical protein MRY87_12960 [bacterium]|nr:hypothetical protein [bacterium]